MTPFIYGLISSTDRDGLLSLGRLTIREMNNILCAAETL